MGKIALVSSVYCLYGIVQCELDTKYSEYCVVLYSYSSIFTARNYTALYMYVLVRTVLDTPTPNIFKRNFTKK
jgi:hypothetical protein